MEKSPDFRIRNKSTNPRYASQLFKNNQKPQQVVAMWQSRINSPKEIENQHESVMESQEFIEMKTELEKIRELDRKQRDQIAQARVQIGKQKAIIKKLKSENEELKQRPERRRIDPRQLLMILQTNLMQEQYREEAFEQMQLEMMINESNAAEEHYNQGHFPGHEQLAHIGLPEEEIANIPVVRIESDHLCSICIDRIKANHNAKILEQCEHKFHPQCIDD
mmetsp:Transcript_10360/g.10324  ORF Transcript_10360/g.10324 Transcript_10360/m.10324 type:complete len:221 (-) Transcript_10360:84-746(-)